MSSTSFTEPQGGEPLVRMWVGDDEAHAVACGLDEGLAMFELDGSLMPGDEGAEEEVGELRRLNPDWQRGDTRIPKLPQQHAPQVRIHAPPRFEKRERRRSVRTGPRRARAPASSDDSESDPPLQVVSLSRFWRDVWRWQGGRAA